MSSLTGAPWRGICKVELEGSDGTRHYTLSTTDVNPVNTPTDLTTWDGAPGDSFTLRLEWATEGLPLFDQADSFTVEMREPNGPVVGDAWTGTISGDSGVLTRTFHFDDNPLNEILGTLRSGMVEMYLLIEDTSGATTYSADSNGDVSTPPTGVRHLWGAGYLRSYVTLDLVELSDSALGGPEPGTFYYPDNIFIRAELDTRTYTFTPIEARIGASVRSKTDNMRSSTREYSWNTTGDRVDADFTTGTHDIRIVLPTSAFGGDAEYVWESTGHDPNFTRENNSTMVDTGRFNVDPSVSVGSLTLDNTADNVFNRGETQSGDLQILNAEGIAFTPQGSDRLGVIDIGTDIEEEVADSATRSAGVIDWAVTFNTSGNTAPADTVGADKKLRWSDDGVGVNSPTTDTTKIGSLSSLYNIDPFLQVNDNTLDPTLGTIARLQSDLGFYSIKVSNQRGQGVNGVTVTDHLRDDQDLVDELARTGTTAAQNGHDGYLPLEAWSASLPGGGWDHWIDPGTHNGNSYSKDRDAVGTFDYTLLASNPALIVMTGGGPVEPAEGHASVEGAVRVGLSVFNVRTGMRVAVDTGTAQIGIVRLMNTGANNGLGEYLDSDNVTWVPLNDPPGVNDTDAIHFHNLGESRPNSAVYIKDFSAAEVAQWTNAEGDLNAWDIFCIGKVLVDSTPYGNYLQVPVMGSINDHAAYVFDGAGFLGFPKR